MNPMLARLVWVPLPLTGCGGGNRHDIERSVGAVTGPRSVSRPRWEGPDPSFVNLKWGPPALAPGGASTVALDLVNRGEQAVGPFRVAVYATFGSVVTANRMFLEAAEVGSLGSSAQHVVVPFTAPAAAGSYAVGPGDGRQPEQQHERLRAAPREVIAP